MSALGALTPFHDEDPAYLSASDGLPARVSGAWAKDKLYYVVRNDPLPMFPERTREGWRRGWESLSQLRETPIDTGFFSGTRTKPLIWRLRILSPALIRSRLFAGFASAMTLEMTLAAKDWASFISEDLRGVATSSGHESTDTARARSFQGPMQERRRIQQTTWRLERAACLQ